MYNIYWDVCVNIQKFMHGFISQFEGDDFQNPEERVYLVPLGRCIMKQEQ